MFTPTTYTLTTILNNEKMITFMYGSKIECEQCAALIGCTYYTIEVS